MYYYCELEILVKLNIWGYHCNSSSVRKYASNYVTRIISYSEAIEKLRQSFSSIQPINDSVVFRILGILLFFLWLWYYIITSNDIFHVIKMVCESSFLSCINIMWSLLWKTSIICLKVLCRTSSLPSDSLSTRTS